MKIVRGIIFGIITFLGLMGVVHADPLDISQCSPYAKEAVIEMVEQGLINGYEDGSFKPKQPVTRAEFIKLFISALDLGLEPYGYSNFTDVPNDHWALNDINSAVDRFIINGVGNNKFNPDGLMTREAMGMLFFKQIVPPTDQRFYGSEKLIRTLSDYDKIAGWSKYGIEVMMSIGVLEGTSGNSFDPKSYLTREQAAVIIHRYRNNRSIYSSRLSNYTRNLTRDEGAYITLGSSEQRVYNVMGINRKSTWIDNNPIVFKIVYPDVTVKFGYNAQNKLVVQAWENADEAYFKTGYSWTGVPFTKGDPEYKVFEAMGLPKTIDRDREETELIYNEGKVYLENGIVIDWKTNVGYEMNVDHSAKAGKLKETR